MRLKDYFSKKKEVERNKRLENEYSFYISHIITEIRLQKQLTQEHLAKLIGTRQSNIARLENGNSEPSWKFLKKISEALSIPLDFPRFQLPESPCNYCSSKAKGNMVQNMFVDEGSCEQESFSLWDKVNLSSDLSLVCGKKSRDMGSSELEIQNQTLPVYKY